MLVVLAIGILLSIAGVVLLANLFGAGDLVISRVTSRPLGELAPGFAAGARGFKIYATLVLSVGILCLGLAGTGWFLLVGVALIVLGAVIFAVASVIAIRGEVETYHGLKR